MLKKDVDIFDHFNLDLQKVKIEIIVVTLDLKVEHYRKATMLNLRNEKYCC